MFLNAFLLTFLAGISTFIGALFINVFKNKDKFLICSLSFAASIMLFVSVLDLIPESYKLLIQEFNKVYVILTIILFFVIGINISLLIEKTLPEKITFKSNKLLKIGIISMIAIMLHNIPEGMATFIASITDPKLGILLAFSIALHNIPEGISIALPIYYGTNKKRYAYFYTLVSGMSEPFGALIAYLFLSPFINNISLGILFAIISGIMFQISLFSILPASFSYKNYKLTILSFIIGLIIVIISIVIV